MVVWSLLGILLGILLVAVRSRIIRLRGADPELPKDTHLAWHLSKTCSSCDDTVQLVTWLIAQGARLSPKIGIADFENSMLPGVMTRGIVALKDIGADELLVEVPKHLALNTGTAESSTIGPFLSEQMPELCVLALHLLNEAANPASLWAPYIRMLPKCSSECSIAFWPEVDLCQLNGSPAHQHALQLRAHRSAMYREHVLPLVQRLPTRFPAADFSEERFCWGCAIHNSHQHPGGILPFIDLFNHRIAGAQAECHVRHQGGLIKTTANLAIPKGRQLFVDYGPRHNEA